MRSEGEQRALGRAAAPPALPGRRLLAGGGACWSRSPTGLPGLHGCRVGFREARLFVTETDVKPIGNAVRVHCRLCRCVGVPPGPPGLPAGRDTVRLPAGACRSRSLGEGLQAGNECRRRHRHRRRRRHRCCCCCCPFRPPADTSRVQPCSCLRSTATGTSAQHGTACHGTNWWLWLKAQLSWHGGAAAIGAYSVDRHSHLPLNSRDESSMLRSAALCCVGSCYIFGNSIAVTQSDDIAIAGWVHQGR